ncbi:MAG: chemotaxis protein CheW [Bacillota bacterium]|jgi:purine-binding chemotaxis protein CheW
MATDNTLDILNLQFTGAENEIQLLVFNVDGEEFGVDVLLVQEIIRYVKPTKIPNAPRAVKGVINFRGEVIPILDVRERFNLPTREYDEFTVIVVVEYNGKSLGLIVDQVSDNVSLAAKDIQLVPDFSGDEKTAYLKGMGKLEKRLILLLDVEKIMNLQDKNQLEAALTEVVPEGEQEC